jgi:glycosyltransferase involved in cell wall biosynthesis
VVVVSSHSRLGGSEAYLETICEHLAPAWIRSVITLEEGSLVDRLQSLGVDVTTIPTTGSKLDVVRRSRELKAELRRRTPDVVHANGVKAAAMVALAAPATPFMWSKHDFSWDGVAGRWIARRAALVVGVSNAVLEPLRGISTPTRVVPPGLDLDRLQLDDGAEVRRLVGTRAAVIVLVGRFHPVKGHLELIEALPEIRADVGDVAALFVGGADPSVPEHADHLRQRVRDRALEDAVVFAGERSDVARLIAGSDVGVVPSVALGRAGKESFSLAALEMLAVGTPVVAYNHGGVPEVLGDCGALVEPGDSSALAAAIVSVLHDPDRRRGMSECGKTRAAENFSVDAMIERLVQSYREVSGR